MSFDAMRKLTRRYHLQPRGVVHVGAHLGQEGPTYREIGATNQLWVEPQPDVFEKLIANVPPSETVRHANVACGAEEGRLSLNIIPKNDAGLSSFLKPSPTLGQLPETAVVDTVEVEVVRLDDLIAREGIDPGLHNLLVLDTQGFELEVLKGAPDFLRDHADYVFTEVSRRPLYENSCLEADIDAHLKPFGFERVYTRLSLADHGDALYIKSDRIDPFHKLRLAVMGPKVRRSRKRHDRALASNIWR